ncbi:hypothetical protein [Streptomyces sp. B6B3]|uniref:hypothetical protein n=1 Tax=Streptomyces sp. B6B3 TaxID=3153570 RepID=UPI00325CC30E
MLDEALVALAAGGGAAVAAAAGTDAWVAVRASAARCFGRGGAEREREERDRLDATAAALRGSGAADDDPVRRREREAWRRRFEDLLVSLDASERREAARELARLVEQHVGEDPVRGVAVTRDVRIRDNHGAIVSGVNSGGVHLHFPSTPDPSKG